jgi:hypothetical protein
VNAPEGGLYRPLVLSLALLLVAAGALLAIQMISSIVGPFRVADLGERDPRAVIAFWRPFGTAAGTAVRGVMGYDLVDSGRIVREVTALGSLDAARIGALVLTEPRDLTPTDVAALEAYVDAGGGAVLIGSVAVRAPDGAWRGYEAMQHVLGARVVPLDEPSAAAFVAARRGPLSSVLAPRQRVAIAWEPGTPAVVVDDAELRWIGLGDMPSGPAAALRRKLGRGRVAWLAAAPERAQPGEEERRRVRRIVEAAIAWVSRTPSVEVLPWPHGAPFAGTVDAAGVPDAADSEAAWRRALDEARRDGGVASLAMPRDPAAREALEPALARALDAAKRDAAWIATRKELSLWLRSRAVIDVSVRRAGPQRLVLQITNRATEDVAGVVVRVHLNEPVRAAQVASTRIFEAPPGRVLSADREAVDLFLPRLEGSSSAAYHLDTEPVGEREGSAG